ncbi:glutamate racemase [bacterium]|nr:glutamate racemase [bacterium]
MNSQLTTTSNTQAELATKKVLVVDSGVGGLSICSAIIDAIPTVEISYLSDSAAFPYGEKSETALIDRVSKLLKHASEHLKPDLIVVACNTASTVALPIIRSDIALPIVGVVPAIKPAAAITQSKVIALLATPGTVSRHYTQQLIEEFASDCQVISLGSAQLVRHIEEYLHGGALDESFLQTIINELKQKALANADGDIDTVVLGCTHFPLIRETWETLENHWQWVDSGKAIADRVKSLLAGDNTGITTAKHQSAHQHKAWFTSEVPTLAKLEHYVQQLGIQIARHENGQQAVLHID